MGDHAGESWRSAIDLLEKSLDFILGQRGTGAGKERTHLLAPLEAQRSRHGTR